MRVLHVVASPQRRGAEMFASDLVRELGGAGVDQRVVALTGTDNGRAPFEAPVRVLPAGWRTPGLRIDLRGVRELRSVVTRWSPDVVQCHGGQPLKYAVGAVAGTGERLVYRKIGAASPPATTGVRRVAHARLIRRADWVVAVAEIVRQEAMTVFGVPAGRVSTIPNAVDARRMAPSASRSDLRRALGIPKEAPVVLALGALSGEKGPLDHADIAARVCARLPDARYLVAGDGPLRDALLRRARSLRVEDRVRLLGSRADVSDLLAAADVLAVTSRTEGMPAAVIEAGMAGLPVAGYAVGGVPEVVTDGTTGILSPPGGLDALAASVLTLLEDEPMRRAMGSAARERCIDDFDIRAVAPGYLSLYERLAGGR